MNSRNRSFTWSGMTTCTVRSDFDVAVTLEDIVEHSSFSDAPISFEEIVAWTDEQVRAYVEEHMLDDLVREGEGGGHVYDTYYEHDDDIEFVVACVEIFEEVEG